MRLPDGLSVSDASRVGGSISTAGGSATGAIVTVPHPLKAVRHNAASVVLRRNDRHELFDFIMYDLGSRDVLHNGFSGLALHLHGGGLA